MQFWIAEVKRGRKDLHDERRQGDFLPHIWRAEFKRRWVTVCSSPRDRLWRFCRFQHSAVLRQLHNNLGFRCFYLRWVPDLLKPELKERRLRSGHEMIPVLEAATKDGWHHLVTGNESWFFLPYSPHQM
jgi:hypothetical protein